MNDQRHDEIRELLGAYALDAVSESEAELVLSHLATCDECREEVGQHHEIAAMIANTGGEAPAHLWERIESRLDPRPVSRLAPIAELQVLDDARTRSTPARARPRRDLQWLGAAAAVILVIGLGAEAIQLQGRVGQLEGASPQQQVTRAAQTALRDPAASKVDLVSTSTERLAQIAILPSGAAFLLNDALPVLPHSRTYQLWAKEGDRLVSLGLLGSHPTAIAFEVGSAAISGFAVTDEHAGGVVHPTSPPIAVSNT
jgi:anti-sigma factor RsiW